MKCSLYSIIYRTILFLYIAAVAYLCFADFHSLPDVQREFFGIPTDKIVHFVMFFPFPWITYSAFARKPKKISDIVVGVVNACATGCIFAGITEIIQGSLAYRSEDVRDFTADCLAICICGIVVLTVRTIIFLKKKR